MFLFVFLLSFIISYSKPVFILNEKIYKDFKLNPYEPNSYLLIEGLNAKDTYSFVVFEDDTKRIYLVLNDKKILVNDEFLKKGNKSFTYLSRGVKFDGKYIYIYAAIKYGIKKHVVLYKVDPVTLKVKYHVFKKPSGALKVFLFADGKGNVLIAWLDEEKLPYRIAWTYSEDFGNTFTKPRIVKTKHLNITLFYPVILNEKPYLVYVSKDELLVNDLLKGKDVKVLKLRNPKYLLVKYKPGNGLWVVIDQNYEKVTVLKLDTNNLNAEFKKDIDTIRINGKEYKLKAFIWDVVDFEIVNDKPVIAIVAKFANNPGVKVYKDVSFVDKFNVLVNKENFFSIIHRTKPFLITYGFPQISSDGKNYIIVYIGKKFIRDNIFLSNGKISDVVLEPPFTETWIPKVVNIDSNLYRLLYPIKKRETFYLKLVDVNAAKLRDYYTLPPKHILEERLRKRIELFTKCQVNDDIKCINNISDPYSRKVLEASRKVKIDVLEYKCNEIYIIPETPLAICKGEIKALIPKGAIPGLKEDKIIKDKINEVWVYIDNEWYYVPKFPMIKFYLKW